MKEKLKRCCKRLPFEFIIPNYKIIFVFIFPVFGVAQERIRSIVYEDYDNEIFRILLYYISHIFSFIPLIIFLIRNKKKEYNINDNIEDSNTNIDENKVPSKNEEANLEKDIISIKFRKLKKYDKLKNILILFFLGGISVAFCHFDLKGAYDKKTIGMSYKILLYFLLSFFILKYKYYIHHFITFGINVLTLISKYIFSIIQSNSEIYVKKHIWFFLLYALSDCLFLVIGKYYMDKFDNTPYFLMFFIGIIICIILLSIAIIKYFIISESNIFSGFNDYINSYSSFFIFLADLVCLFIYNLGLWMTVYYFTPCHTIISDNIMEIYYNIYDFKSNLEYWQEQGYSWNIWVIPTVLVINLICSLIFNEIILLKCCKLDYYTRKRIEERERNESNIIFNYIDESFQPEGSGSSSLLDESTT